MSRKISDFFKIESKTTKVDENSSKVLECQVILKDIKHQLDEKELKLFDEISLNQHKSSGKEKKECKYCGKKIHSDMKEHIKKVHPTELNLIYCQICTLKFLRKSNFDIHMKAKHPDGQIENFECDFDGKVFKTKGVLSKHMESHLPLIKCKICQKILKTRSINSHMSYFHGNDENFQCKFCLKSFKHKHYLTIHIKIHNKKLKCEICKKLYPSQGELNKHKRLYHDYEKSFKCEFCGKKFIHKDSLKSHQKIHDKNRPKPYKCQRCDYSTDNKRHINDHQKFHERQDKKFSEMKNPLKCDECSVFCRDKTALRFHVKHVHPKILYQCDLCAKFFKVKIHLVSHISMHIRNFI